MRTREVERLLAETRERHGTTAAARERFRMSLVRSFYAEYARVLQGGAIRDGEEIEKALRRGGYLNRVVERAWPAVVPEKLVRSLYSTPAVLAEAAEDVLSRGRAAAAAAARSGLERRRRAAARRGARARRDAAADVRPRDRGRGAGPHPDAAADDRAARAWRRAHDPRRRRAGNRGGRLRELGRDPAAPAAGRRGGRRGAPPRLSRARARSWSSRCRCST